MKITKKVGESLLTIAEFSVLKGVSKQAVWKAIHADRIPVTAVGASECIFLDMGNDIVTAFIFSHKKNLS